MKFLMTTTAAVFASSVAFAGGYVAPTVETAPMRSIAPIVADTDWTGFYAGLQYAQGDAKVSAGGESNEQDFNALSIHAGYQRDIGRLVVGGELDHNRADVDNSDEDADLTRLRARAGYDAGRFLPYLALGVVRLATDDGDISIIETGFTYGVGVDFRLAERFTLGLEYSRSDFSDLLEDETGIPGIDTDIELIQIRASYRF